jgi:hypothetical protein
MWVNFVELDGAIPIPKTIVSACGSGEELPGCRHSSTTTVLRTARRRGDGWLGDVGRCYAVAAAYPAAVSVPQPIVGLTSQRCRIAYSKAASNWSSRPAWVAIFRIATLAIESPWPTPRATSARTRRIAASRATPQSPDKATARSPLKFASVAPLSRSDGHLTHPTHRLIQICKRRNGAKPIFYGRWKRRPDGQAHFSIAPAASIHPDGCIASLRKHFDGCYLHRLTALTRGLSVHPGSSKRSNISSPFRLRG